jgi:hypothetical protein
MEEENKKNKIFFVLIVIMSLTFVIAIPTITFLSPTPGNGTTVNYSNVTIIANITDESGTNTSSWIDFDKSLLLHIEFDWYNNSGIYDNSSYNNFMKFNAGLNTSNIVPSVIGDGFYFNGSCGVLSSMKSIPIGNYSDFSVSYWENLSRQDKDGHTPMTIGWNYGDGIGIGIRPSTSGTYGIYLGNNFYSFGYNYRNGDLYQNVMITITHDNQLGVTKLYRNGVLNSTITTRRIRFGFSNPNVQIGGESTNYRSSNGTFDHFLLYNRVISPNEVSVIYNSQANNLNVTFSNLSNIQHNYTISSINMSAIFNTTGLLNFITNSTYNLTITNPTTISPRSVIFGNNVSIYFNFLDSLVNLTDTSKITINDVYLDGNRTSLLNDTANILFRMNDTGTTSSSNPVTISFPAFSYSNYSIMFNPLSDDDVPYSLEWGSRGTSSFTVKIEDDESANEVANFMWGAIPYGYYNINGNIIQCNQRDFGDSSRSHQFYELMKDPYFSVIMAPPSTTACSHLAL